MSAKFLISILSMRMESGVRACVESVLANSGKRGYDFNLFLTANGSQEVLEYFKTVPGDVVWGEENQGYIAPNNAAMEVAKEWQVDGPEGGDYEYLVTLNDDAIVPAGWLEAIEAEFKRHPAAAIVGARGGCRTLNGEFHGYSGASLDYIEGSCAAYRVSAFSKHKRPLFNPALEFAYGEDSSVSLEMQQLGYSIHEANFEIEHKRGATSAHVPRVKESQAKNHAWAKKHFAHWLKHRTFAHRIIVKRTAAIGDVLLTTPVIRALWTAYPLCTIHVETLSPQLFDGNHYVTSAGLSIGRHATDMVIDLDGAYEATPMRHIVKSYAKAAGVEIEHDDTDYRVSAAGVEWSNLKVDVAASRGIVAVHAGLSTWPSKNWPLGNWRELIEELQGLDYAVVLVGSQTNLGMPCDLDLTGKTSIDQLMAVMRHCDFCVSIDSFPLHASQAVGTPVVGLFGVTTPELICTSGSRWVAARSSEFHPDTGLRHRVAGATMIHATDDVMRTISVDSVLQAIAELTQIKINA